MRCSNGQVTPVAVCGSDGQWLGLLKETRDSSFERLGLLPLSWSAGKGMELLPGKCSLLSDTVLLSPEADTRKELFLHIMSVTDQHCHLICC